VHRFFAPDLHPGAEVVTLPRDEGEHLARVLRLGAGDTVSVFDGRGNEFLARVENVARRDVRVALLRRVVPPSDPTVAITLGQAVLKSDKMDDVIRDAVMLGVAAIQPIVTTRSETTVAALARNGRIDRWRRVALASVKQSGRATLPDIRQPLTFESLLDEPRPEVSLMLVEPGAGAHVESLKAVTDVPSDALVLIGPEGGWTSKEWEAAAARGMRLISLGAQTLRADAVPVAVLSVLRFLWDDR
jgi:16S rRNA (uracil1498-N3)-methyltransferase